MVLFLNSIGIWEILLVLMIVLMLFGANSIPSIARTLGRGIRQVRDVSSELKRDINTTTHRIREDLEKGIDNTDNTKPKTPPSDPEKIDSDQQEKIDPNKTT